MLHEDRAVFVAWEITTVAVYVLCSRCRLDLTYVRQLPDMPTASVCLMLDRCTHTHTYTRTQQNM